MSLRPNKCYLVYSSLRFITGDGFQTQCCELYLNVGRFLLGDRRERHRLLFVYQALQVNRLHYFSFAIRHHKRSQQFLSFETAQISTE